VRSYKQAFLPDSWILPD